MSRIEATGGMAGGVGKQTNKWPKDVDNDNAYSKNEKPGSGSSQNEDHDAGEFCYG
ncbi:hypothetical protein FoTM2_014679 [Fusarium oxysporum f. sp. vasinfectum]|uniref:Uncharacterized protein n=1 Tax=Fusarium oxysporum f. sp. vasinfectum 25433 TaxID=1089449 RepID=X0KF82_FUSOX|nr:hypothetical protein FOTG_19240 [Fusarium oxysporum f. sp. vasinfectum 25433]KAK2926310.1 hypothetical protein FoTM2_014679 [Fusarium oxysporum f. sp. vasinfectum]